VGVKKLKLKKGETKMLIEQLRERQAEERNKVLQERDEAQRIFLEASRRLSETENRHHAELVTLEQTIQTRVNARQKALKTKKSRS
jgi:hypothetical protein